MEQLPAELVDITCQSISLGEMSKIRLLDKYFNLIISGNAFYVFCRKSFKHKSRDRIITHLMTNVNHFHRFLLNDKRTYRDRGCSYFVSGARANYTHGCTYLLEFACANNFLEIAILLKKIRPNIDLRSNFEDSFFSDACSNSNLEVAKWLVQMEPDIKSSANINWSFILACTT